MNIYDLYPDEIEVEGRVYRLNMSFDRVLRAIDVQERQDLLTEDKIDLQARLLLWDEKDCPSDPVEQAKIVAGALALLPESENPTGERYIDFHQDAAMIRSAFFRIGVDLTREHLHINQFLELLADLPSDTALMRTIEIRRRPIPKATKDNAEQIAALLEAKSRVAIRMSEDERRARFAESLKKSSVMRG